MIEIIINGKKIKTEEGKTILEAARENNIDIPALCNHSDLKPGASCRICAVEIKGSKKLLPACATKARPNMEVITDSPKISKTRKINLELLFSQHKEECFDCVWNGECSLLDLVDKYKVKINRFDDRKKNYPVYQFGNAIQFDSSKCIDCRNCIEACHLQGVDFLEIKERGSLFQVVPSETKDCIYCGQCLIHCPAGAFESVGEFEDIEKPLKQKDKIVVFQFAPSIRSTLGEEFGMSYGKLVTGKIVAGLKRLGVDKIFDTCVGADFTTTSEAEEVVERIKSNKNLPILTSCCPSWVKFLEQKYPEFIPNISTTRSPQVILGGLIKTYWAKEQGLDPKKIFVVSVMPCTAKKFEIIRPENNVLGMRPVDCVLTTREFARLLMRHNIDLSKLKPEKMDNMFGDPSGAGVIYGASGGVMESAFRTAYEKITNTKLKNVEFKQVRGMQGVKEAEVRVGSKTRKIAVINGLGLAKKFIEEIKSGKRKDYTCIEAMACPGGCVGGGGQPVPTDAKIREKRALSLYEVDKKKKIRKAHENPIVKKIYKEFLKDKKLAHKILHTSYGRKGRGLIKKI
ncbi:MAG: hypothetical protein A2V72_02140 [Candidatus Nealsonbacteria bacterium RBG_13_37_56]|uniref:Ferredoxin n=1 Tax=Candidatus Nealsonbacteria bacterium RBG_13_37_56 TaxID=1801661 RepID=A0A1G2DYG6_9BACT|nr:MAG: hypothetical protein A2V72_02140 [Candidatus Nealsonbacteria bacterium RBG_13_37_56]